jgi:hypothetical protein
MVVEPGGVGPGFPGSSVGRGVGDTPLAFMTSVAVGKAVCVGCNVAVARGAVAEDRGLGEGNAVVGLLSTLTVAVTVLVAVAVWSVGIAEGSTSGVTVAVEPGTTAVGWNVAVGRFAGAGVAKGDGQGSGPTRRALATPMIPTITRAIADWPQDGCQREKPE